MKVEELVQLLYGCDPEAEVLVWADGVRYPLSKYVAVDHWCRAFVDLNIVTVVNVDQKGEAHYVGDAA